jgi:hypothetical protein
MYHANQLIINTEKTKALFCQGKRPNPIHRSVSCLNGKKVSYSSVTFLGIYITAKTILGHPHPPCLSKIE